LAAASFIQPVSNPANLVVFAGQMPSRRQHDGGGVVRHESRDHDADSVHEIEQAAGRTLGMAHRPGRDPVEQAGGARHVGDQHHPDQEQVDVRALAHRVADLAGRQLAGDQQQQGAQHRPPGLADLERPRQHACRGKRRDRPDDQRGECQLKHRRNVESEFPLYRQACLAHAAELSSSSSVMFGREGRADIRQNIGLGITLRRRCLADGFFDCQRN
jgi:hypothetical protein